MASVLAWLLVLLNLGPGLQAQPRIFKVHGFDSDAQAVRALDQALVMDEGDPTLLVADQWGGRIVRVRFDRDVRQRSETLAGSTHGGIGFTPDGWPARGASISAASVAHTSQGQILFVDTQGLASGSRPAVVRMIDPAGRLLTLAGAASAGASPAGVPAAGARLGWSLGGLVVDGQDSLFLADTHNDRILKFSLGGNLEVVAETANPVGLALRGDDLYITDPNHGEVRKLSLSTHQLTQIDTHGAVAEPVAIAVTAQRHLFLATTPWPSGRAGLFSLSAAAPHPAAMAQGGAEPQDGLPVADTHLLYPQAILAADDSGLLLAEQRGLFFIDMTEGSDGPDPVECQEALRTGSEELPAMLLAFKVPHDCQARNATLEALFRETRRHSFPPELVDLVASYGPDPETERMLDFRARFMLNTLRALPEFRLRPELSPGWADRAAIAGLRRHWPRPPGTPLPAWLIWLLDGMGRY